MAQTNVQEWSILDTFYVLTGNPKSTSMANFAALRGCSVVEAVSAARTVPPALGMPSGTAADAVPMQI